MNLWLITWIDPAGGLVVAGAVVEAPNELLAAVELCATLGITPDGAAQGEHLPPGSVDAAQMNRLLSPEEAEAIKEEK